MATGVGELNFTEPVVSMVGSSAPYALQAAGIDLSLPKTGVLEDVLASEGRGCAVSFDSSGAEFVILRAAVDGSLLRFQSMDDTIPVAKKTDLEQAIMSESFQSGGTLSLKILYTSWNVGSNATSFSSSAGFKLVLRDASTGVRAAVIKTFNRPSDAVVGFKVAVPDWNGSLRLGLEGLYSEEATSCALERWIHTEGEASLGKDDMISLESRPEVPTEFVLDQNYPNPFNPSTTIRYGLPHKSNVQLTVYNTLGQQVVVIVQGEEQAGYHEVRFEGSNLASGAYLYRLTAGSFVQARRLLLLK
jgi:hypothetical protein